MALPRYLLDGPKVRSLRKAKGWKREALVNETKGAVSVRTLIHIETARPYVLDRIAKAVAAALDSPIESITKEIRYPDGGPADLPIPGMNTEDQECLNRARDCDMAGKHKEAIALTEKLLARVDNNDFALKAAVTIKLATFLDNAGKHVEALETLDRLMQEPFFRTQVEEKVQTWALYHRAIALRRLARFDDAERQLRPVLENCSSEHRVAANHELGVICLERFSQSKNTEHLTKSLCQFMQSRARWHSQRNHREGFALHRMAQVYALQERYNESIECFFEAVVIFARCRCARYVKEIRADLKTYVLAKCSVAPDNVVAPLFEGPTRKSAGD